MLFERGRWSRAMIGLRLERHSGPASPSGRLLPRDRGRRGGVHGDALAAHEASEATKWPGETSTSGPIAAPVEPAVGGRVAVRPLRVQLRHGVEQHLRVRVPRVGEDRSGRAELDHAAVAEDHGAVADVVAEREVVGDEEDAEAARREVAQDVEDVDAGRGVEHADDLVRDQQLEVEHQRPRDQQALQLAAAELVRVLAEHGGGLEADGLEGRTRSRSSHSSSPRPGRKGRRIRSNTRSALKTGLYELNGSWKTPWTLA